MEDPVVHDIQRLLIERKQTVSAAESCTGGALSARLTQMPGCSNYFLGGVIAYSNNLKINLLEVDEMLLQKEGAVSETTVVQMAEGIIRLTGSDYGLGVTGIAGPSGGTPTKPVGTVWVAIGCRGKQTRAWRLELQGTRQQIIDCATTAIVERFLEYIRAL